MILNSGMWRGRLLSIEARLPELKYTANKPMTPSAPMLRAPLPPQPSLALLVQPAVVLAPDGHVLEANSAAGDLFRLLAGRARRSPISSPFPRACGRRSKGSSGGVRPVRAARRPARRRRAVRRGRRRARARGGGALCVFCGSTPT